MRALQGQQGHCVMRGILRDRESMSDSESFTLVLVVLTRLLFALCRSLGILEQFGVQQSDTRGIIQTPSVNVWWVAVEKVGVREGHGAAR